MTADLVNQIAKPGGHENTIKNYFGGNVKFLGKTPMFDSPIALLLFSNRSGSNLLAEHLIASERFCGLQETLNFDRVEEVSEKHQIRSFPDYLQAIAVHNMSKNIFGTKCSLDQLTMLLRWNILSMFSGFKVINIERHDIVSQSVSMSIASQTRSWSSDTPALITPSYDFPSIKAHFENFAADMVKRRALLDVLNIESRTFEYKQVVSEPFKVVSECCRFFDVPVPAERSADTRLKKQGGELNREFCQKFRAEMSSKILGDN